LWGLHTKERGKQYAKNPICNIISQRIATTNIMQGKEQEGKKVFSLEVTFKRGSHVHSYSYQVLPVPVQWVFWIPVLPQLIICELTPKGLCLTSQEHNILSELLTFLLPLSLELPSLLILRH
jgi:hypothetical protein